MKIQWIPTEERLPEKRRMVLMYFTSGNMYVGCLMNITYGVTVWGVKESDCPGLKIICDPDFWMPLPEPPEADN